MKILKRFVSIILSCLFIINLSPSIQAIEPTELTDQLTEYIVPVISNEYNNSTVIFYGYENKYYLNIKDIVEFTRCEISENDSSIILTHGLREIVIDKETGHMTDTTIVDQGIIPFLKFDEEYLCEGIPMLLYLGAACTIRNNEALEILMPTFTIWESIMPNYLDFYFDISELYGGENNVKERLFFDILSDVLDGVSGHGLFANGDVHLEDALYEILNVDIMKYASVQEEIALQNSDINNFISSDSVMNILKYNLETGNQIIDSTNSIIEQYSNFYLNAEIWKNEKLWQHYYKLDDMDSVSELSTKINQQVYEQSVLKSNNKYIDSIQETLDLGILALDTAVTSYNLMRYDQDTKNLFRNTINDEVLNYAGYYDISWDNISNKISNTLSSNSSIIKNTATGKVAEYVVSKVTSEGVEQALKGFTNKANIYATALEIGLFISSLINRDYHEAHSAEMNAIWLSTVQYDIAHLTARMLKREWTESHFSNTETLEYLKYMFSLYYRTTIAFAENIAISVEEFGGKNKNQLVKYFSSTTEASVGNYSAIYLYRMTNCTLVPIVDYNLITDDFLSSEWMNSFKINTEISIPIHQGQDRKSVV